ncbi:MAG: energy-coupling factor transporter transmembrane protein EcfT [Lachnospiraceae bacterium]|nr:energy-coupling factor transporter transmembrane protein EcfT [Lachnospiraceae bacterium]
MREITLGQYYPADSLLHRLDPRVKFIGTILYIVSLFIANTWYSYILCAVFLAACIALSKVPVRFMVRGLRSILFLLLFMMAINILFTPGEYLFSWKFLHVSKEGIAVALKMGVRLTFLVMGSSVMTLTTTPKQLTDAMERIFMPLRIFHVPVHEIAMMMSIALRFIPILMEETDKIMKAQTARGADFESGGLIRRVKSMVPLLVPLFVSAFRRAGDLALAMEARCYHGGDDRTQMKPLLYGKRDYIAYALLILYLAVLILMRIFL